MKDVLIKIKGSQITAGGREDVDLTTVGKLWRRNGVWALSYDEIEAPGMECAKTTVSFDGETVVLKRSGGSGSTRMTIQRDKRHMCLYDTGFGDMTVGTFGQSVESSLNEHGGECFMRYTVDINSGYESVNELYFSVKEAASRVSINH
ncbi:MAG: DUF1934 domain-containing protein [Oscillospiraceae bacterium]|nr:DUF1934 domain-containing protein [Oscillospiraceae bacterium]